jgi:hypothetical protein
MNSSDPHDSLSGTLADWRVQPKADPNFRPAVWQRIRQKTHETWATYVRAHLAAWSIAAFATVVIAGVAGVSAGRAELSDQRETMVVSYLVELDPRVQAKLRP